MKTSTIRKRAICAMIAAVMAIAPVITASAEGDDRIKSEISRTFYGKKAGDFDVPWDGYTGIQKELVDDICGKFGSRVEINRESIWCSDKNIWSNSYMIVGSYVEHGTKYYFSALYEENGDNVFLSEFHTTDPYSVPMSKLNAWQLDIKTQMIAAVASVLYETYPEAEIESADCKKILGKGIYVIRTEFSLDGSSHRLNAEVEFDGDGRSGDMGDHYLIYSMDVDGENVYSTEKVYKHSTTGEKQEAEEPAEQQEPEE